MIQVIDNRDIAPTNTDGVPFSQIEANSFFWMDSTGRDVLYFNLVTFPLFTVIKVLDGAQNAPAIVSPVFVTGGGCHQVSGLGLQIRVVRTA